tara:strand:- start:12355 stop:12669 length:315 start_codon:yes stop_codon:yes gene_type:complete
MIISLLQTVEVPKDLTSVNKLLTYLLGVMLFVIGFLYVEKRKELKAKDNDVKELNDKISAIVKDHKDDLKAFSEDKTKSIVEITTALNKFSMLIDQLKNIVKNE